MTTVGGQYRAVDALVEHLEAQGKFARKMKVKGSGHTSALDPIMGELEGEIAGIEAHPLRIPLYSSVDRGEVYQPGAVVHDDKYFLRMTRQPVWFQDATEQALAAGHGTLVEIAPNPVAIMGMMNTAFSAGKSDAQLLYVFKRKVDEAESLRDLLAKLYVQGAPIDFGVGYGPGSLIDAPLTEFKPLRYWTKARPSSGSASAGLPGTRVRLPEGRVAFSTNADQVPSPIALMEMAAAQVNSGAELVATEEKTTLPATGEVTTIVDSGLGGLRITVYAIAETGTSTLVAEGFASTLGSGTSSALPGVADAEARQAATDALTEQYGIMREPTEEDLDVEVVRWDPSSGESVEDRLRSIVSESMGYDVDDLPSDLPLMDLGLDSLMGMRIKNRVENDFQIPPLQVQALRDASVADVVAMVEDSVANRAPAQVPTQAPEREKEEKPAAESTGAGVGVAPRDASERMVFGTWAKVTGAAAAGVTSELASISQQQAADIAARLTERSGIEVTADAVAEAKTLEPLADLVREGLETTVEGNVRVLRPRTESNDKPAVFMFHPAGGSTVVYEPLTRRLDEDVPVYGIERLEGTLEERAKAYVEDIKQYAEGHPVILGGWSFGGALAYEVAHQLRGDVDAPSVEYIALLDTTQPANPAPDTMEETKARWQRYADFASKTYGLEFEVPFELLETAGEEALMGMLEHYLANTDASAHGLSAGVLEHQRASFVDNQILARVDFARWAGVDAPVLLFRSERMHDGAIELEPAYAEVNEDGGWGAIVEELEIVQLPGDHLAVPDEPAIGIVGAHMMKRINDDNR